MFLIPPLERLPSCALSVTPSRAGPDLTIVVAGEAVCATADQLHDQLVEAFGPEVGRLTLDLGGLSFCNLRGLGALHQAVVAARRSGIDVTVRGMSRQLTWLHAAFPDRLSIDARQELAWSGPRRGLLVVETATGPDQPWESAGTA